VEENQGNRQNHGRDEQSNAGMGFIADSEDHGSDGSDDDRESAQ